MLTESQIPVVIIPWSGFEKCYKVSTTIPRIPAIHQGIYARVCHRHYEKELLKVFVNA